MKVQTPEGAWITDYAREHLLPASGIVAVITYDDDAPRPIFTRNRLIRTRDGDYADGYYQLDYLDLVRAHLYFVLADRCPHGISVE